MQIVYAKYVSYAESILLVGAVRLASEDVWRQKEGAILEELKLVLHFPFK